jgi:hypothetical protein
MSVAQPHDTQVHATQLHQSDLSQSGPELQAGAAKQPDQAQLPEPASWLWVLFLAMFLGVFCVGPLVVYFATRNPGIAALIEGLIALAAGIVLATIGARRSIAAARAFKAAAPRPR